MSQSEEKAAGFSIHQALEIFSQMKAAIYEEQPFPTEFLRSDVVQEICVELAATAVYAEQQFVKMILLNELLIDEMASRKTVDLGSDSFKKAGSED